MVLIPWWWLLIFFVLGGMIGVACMSMMFIAKESDGVLVTKKREEKDERWVDMEEIRRRMQ